MTMRTKLAVAALLLTSCLNPDDIFPLSGTVETPGQHVTLQRGPRATPDECGEDFVSFKETDANERGEWSFEIFRAQAQSLTTGFPFCFRASTAYASGTKAWGVTRNVQSNLEFPLLPDWRAQLSEVTNSTLLPDGGTVSSKEFRVFPMAFENADDLGFLDRYSVELTGADDVVQWRQGDSQVEAFTLVVERTPMTADPRVVKEFGGGTARATGRYNRASQIIDGLSGEVRTLWTPTIVATSGDTLFIDGPALIPPSRGAACEGFASCPFTDGVLSAAEPGSSAITLHFAEPISARLVVLRGVVTPYVEPQFELPSDPGTVVLAAFNADGGSVGAEPGFGGVLASATFVHDFDGSLVRPDGGVAEYPPTYLAIPVKTSEPISSLRLLMPALRVEEISVWPGGYSVQ